MQAISADFTISPVRVFFVPGKKAEVVTIKNNSDEKLTIQLSSFLWEQDESASDKLTPTDELVLFPKIVSIEKKEERIIRIGIKTLSGKNEKTYRIFVEEVPEPKEKQPEGATLRTLMKIGVPVFISPLKTEFSGKVAKGSLKNGVLSFSIKNEGNVHFIVHFANLVGMDEKGGEVFKKELAGWYVHQGKEKPFSTEIPKDTCLKIKTIKINVDTDRMAINDSLAVTPEMCPL